MGNTDVSISTSKARVEHVTIATGLSYDRLVSAFEGELGRFDPAVAKSLMDRRAPWSEVKAAVERMGGAHGLMIIFSADQGAVTSLSGKAKRCSLYIVGNPVIANEILDVDPGASFYVPFRIALYDSGEPDGAVISYDRPSSFLATLGREELEAFGALLDQKVDSVIKAVVKR
jgi:uncharacterized protein (DUF302 family)